MGYTKLLALIFQRRKKGYANSFPGKKTITSLMYHYAISWNEPLKAKEVRGQSRSIGRFFECLLISLNLTKLNRSMRIGFISSGSGSETVLGEGVLSRPKILNLRNFWNGLPRRTGSLFTFILTDVRVYGPLPRFDVRFAVHMAISAILNIPTLRFCAAA